MAELIFRERPTRFVSALAYRILDSMPAVIITGGFLHSNKKPSAISTDAAALEGSSPLRQPTRD